jgi:hypothetical protein
MRAIWIVPKTVVFGTLRSPTFKRPVHAYNFVSKLIPKSKFQNLTNSMSFGTLFKDTKLPTMTTEQKKRLLKAKVAVALQNELGRVPKKEEIEEVTLLARVLYKAILGLHYKRKEQKKTGQLAIF